MTNLKLAFHVAKQSVNVGAMAHDIIGNDPCICLVANDNPAQRSLQLPLIVNVVNEVDERRGAVSRTKGHDNVGPFNCIGPLKCQFFLTL